MKVLEKVSFFFFLLFDLLFFKRELKNVVLEVKWFKLENGDLDDSIDGSIIDEQLMDVVVDVGVLVDGLWNSCGWLV